MTTPKDGGPAFPCPGMTLPNEHVIYPDPGMSLRDYFAAAALTSIASSATYPVVGTVGPGSHFSAKLLAEHAYAIADAMLEQRGK